MSVPFLTIISVKLEFSAGSTHDRLWLAPRRRADVVQRRAEDKCDSRVAGVYALNLVAVVDVDRDEGLHYADHRGHALRVFAAGSAGWRGQRWEGLSHQHRPCEDGFAGVGEYEILTRRIDVNG